MTAIKKTHVNTFDSPPLSVHDEHNASSAAENVKTKSVVSKTHIPEIDSDEQANVL